MNTVDKKGFISCEFNKIDLLDTPYKSKLENNILFVQFNFYNISNVEIKEVQKGWFFKKRTEYIIKVFETFYTQTDKVTFISTTIEFEEKEVMDDFLLKLSNKVQEVQSKNVDILKRTNKKILSYKSFQDIKRIAFEAERQIAKLPSYNNIHKCIIKFDLEEYDVEAVVIDLLRKEFNFVKELELEDLYIEENELSKKRSVVALYKTINNQYDNVLI